MIEAAVSAPSATPAPVQQATPPANGAPPAATGTETQVLTGEPKPERPKAKVGDVDWEQDEDGEWYSTQKVNGKEERISHQQALSAARQMKASTERFQEARKIESQIEGMLASAASSPRATAHFLAQLGVDVQTFAEIILGERVEESRLTPEQRQLREYQTRLEAYEREKADAARREHETKVQEHERRTREAYVQAFDQQLDALHAPKAQGARQWMHARIAALANHCEDNGIPTTLGELTKRAARDFQEMTGTKFQAPAPVAPAKPGVSVPSQAQQPGGNAIARDQRNGQFVRRGDPKPPLNPGDPDSVRARIEWSKRNPGR